MPRKQNAEHRKSSCWDLSVVEQWCLYARKTGFQPTGPHRQLLDQLFFRHWNECTICNGVGVVDGKEAHKWKDCPICHSLGGFYSGSQEEWQELIFRVLSEYPDSACGDRKSEYLDIYRKYLNS